MKRTTIFLTDELHEQLQEAFRAKASMAEIVRQKLRQPAAGRRRPRFSPDPLLKVAGVCRGPVLSSEIDEALYGG